MFYERFAELCAQKGLSQAAAVQTIGLNRAAISKWKKGSLPQGSTVSKLAELFGVSVDYLLGGPNEKDPAAKSREVSDDDLKFALFGGGPVSDAQFEEVKRFAQFVKERDAIENK